MSTTRPDRGRAPLAAGPWVPLLGELALTVDYLGEELDLLNRRRDADDPLMAVKLAELQEQFIRDLSLILSIPHPAFVAAVAKAAEAHWLAAEVEAVLGQTERRDQ